jgi:hypothetical protein
VCDTLASFALAGALPRPFPTEPRPSAKLGGASIRPSASALEKIVNPPDPWPGVPAPSQLPPLVRAAVQKWGQVMDLKLKSVAGALSLLAATAVSGVAHADYFITPYAQLGSGSDNGYAANGATSGSASVYNGGEATALVDMNAGTIKTFLSFTGQDVTGSDFGQAAGVFGDRVTFSGPLGSTINFGINFDGLIYGDDAEPALDDYFQIGVIANLRVFDPSAGATSANFAVKDGALVSDTINLDFSNPSYSFYHELNESLAGSLVTTGGVNSYDVFVSFSIFTAMNGHPANVYMDFLNTATFGITADPGVTYTSEAGLLGSDITPTAAVPEPTTWALMILGFGAAGAIVRRRRGALA